MTSPSSSARSCTDDCLACFLQRHPICDGTPRSVQVWGAIHDVDDVTVLDFLESRGGFCDCEALLNVLRNGRIVLDDAVLACG